MENVQMLTVNEARSLIRCGRTKFYQHVGAGAFRLYKFGRSSRVRQDEFLAWMATLPAFKPRIASNDNEAAPSTKERAA